MTFKQCVLVSILTISGAILTTSASVNAATSHPPIPLMLSRVDGSPVVYVVSTSNYFDAAHPSACKPHSCFLLRRTTNLGASFATLGLPPVTYVRGSLDGNLEDLVFANTFDGYALLREGSFLSLYVTLDGASTWHRQSVAPGEHVLQVVTDHNQLFAVVAHCRNNHACTDLRLARSTLAAKKWTVTKISNTSSHSPSLPSFDITAFGPNVWATVQGPKYPLLYRSRDGGRTFTASSAPALSAVTACSLTAESSSVLWAECPTGMMVSFFFSGDAGVHWINVSGLGYAGTGGGYFDPVSRSLAYLDYGQIGPSRPKNLFRITNAGRTSTPVGTLRCDGAWGLVFTDATHGLAVCNRNYKLTSTYLLRTSNGGATWSSVTWF